MTCQRCTHRSNYMQAVSRGSRPPPPDPTDALRMRKASEGAVGPLSLAPNPLFFTQNPRERPKGAECCCQDGSALPFTKRDAVGGTGGVAGRMEGFFCKADG